MTKKIAFVVLLVLAAGLIVNACTLSGLTKGNTTLAKEMRNLSKDGFEYRADMSYYNQHRYLVAPTAPYVDGFGEVVMMKSAGGYSLTTWYAHISFEGWVNGNNKCSTKNVSTYIETIY